ncbi:MAG: hypothetical protein EKK48_10180 [Candidatus Melainabacteria bacterium]|nr:MAG: hypothetical protein EKK48_10180 [Candidatus Melainabacteria bacterium]
MVENAKKSVVERLGLFCFQFLEAKLKSRRKAQFTFVFSLATILIVSIVFVSFMSEPDLNWQNHSEIVLKSRFDQMLERKRKPLFPFEFQSVELFALDASEESKLSSDPNIQYRRILAGDYEEPIKNLRILYQHSTRENKFWICMSLCEANVHSGNYAMAEQYAREGLTLLTQLDAKHRRDNDAMVRAAAAYTYLGEASLFQRDYKRAEKYFEQAKHHLSGLSYKDQIYAAETNFYQGLTQFLLERPATAKSLFYRCMQPLDQHVSSDKQVENAICENASVCQFWLALLYQQNGNLKQALESYERLDSMRQSHPHQVDSIVDIELIERCRESLGPKWRHLFFFRPLLDFIANGRKIWVGK